MSGRKVTSNGSPTPLGAALATYSHSRNIWALRKEEIMEQVALGQTTKDIAKALLDTDTPIPYRTLSHYINRERQRLAAIQPKLTTAPDASPEPDTPPHTPLYPAKTGFPQVKKFRFNNPETLNRNLK